MSSVPCGGHRAQAVLSFPPCLPPASSTVQHAPSEWWQNEWIDGKAHRWSTLGKETERCLPFQGVWESSPSQVVPSVSSPPSHPGWKRIGLFPHSDLRLGSICPHKQPPPCLFCQQDLPLGGRTSRQHHLSRGSPRADAQPSPPPTPVRPSLEPGWGSHLGTWRHCLSTSGWRKHPFKQVVELSMHRCKFPSSLASSSVFPIAEVWSE